MVTSLPTVTIQSTGAAQTAVPFTFGQVFAPGHLLPADGLAAEGVPLQVDVKATHPDGSVRHAVISGVLPRLAAGEVVKLQLAKATPRMQGAQQPVTMVAAGAVLSIGGAEYRTDISGAANPNTWLTGPLVNETSFAVPLLNTEGKPHPRLSARLGVRWFGARARVEFVIENTKTFSAGSNETYDVALLLNGQVVYERKALTHYHHARWRATAWTGGEPALIVHPDTAYLIATKAVSNYDRSVVVSNAKLDEMAAQITSDNTGPMTVGPVNPAMGTTGGRPDIGPLPAWTVAYLLSNDARARRAMEAAAEGSASWPIHYRDENTTYPIRTDSEKNASVSLHPNMSHLGPLPVPRFVPGSDSGVPLGPDAAHQPSLAYFPYLITGDYYYLEELHFWAAWNPLETAAGYSGNGAGLVRWQQLRGQAWSMRTLGHAAYITPDAHPLKSYFNKQLDSNLDYYQKLFLAPTANAMGVYDGTGEGAYATDGYSPWQDDFFTWSFGYLSELGFTKAEPILQWKAKYPVGRMTAPGFCWIQASKYFYNFSEGPGAPRYKTFAELYAGNFKEDNIRDDNSNIIKHPQGLKYNDQPCGSQEQADWFKAAGIPWWVPGRMVGYADSVEGYPANMQPALAVAAVSGIENAEKAWEKFDARAAKPNYGNGPQFAIIPRGNFVQPPVAQPVPQPILVPTTTMAVVVAPAGGTWQDVGVEGAKVDVPKDTIVRYGAGDKFVVAKVGGPFLVSNAFFGRDPAVNVVKKVQKFIAGKPGKIITPSSTKLAKRTKLSVSLFDPKTLSLVKKFDSVTANSKGTITLSDAAISVGTQYAAVVSDAAGNVVLIQFPLLGS